ncbi:MAG: NUDIX domain-containing protein [Alsobacter sp.]
MMADRQRGHPALLDRSFVHKGWSTYSILRLRLPNGAEVSREVEDHGPAVCVLPYDPVRRVAVLVRQFRSGPFLASEVESLLEVPAGLLDEDDPAEGARREAEEETGLRLGELEPVVDGWSMPGISTERMVFFLAPFGEADRIGDGGGLDEEHEDIEVVEVPLAELSARAQAGEITDVKTLLLAFALQVRHPELFA